ncbi:type 4 pilus major pilin [Bosea sp. RAC05]|uniref:type 4 pilus major pilin n=1 Tax=Bosea sp. RAC05 TaxID=1842539 RepID=UPI00083E007C|nr:type 4 pilus major pilin [Bosea sp. RAC05]AOG02927.1 bundlin family protein [Bosea sp. RAC05]
MIEIAARTTPIVRAAARVRRGLTLIEAAAVLGLLAIVVAGALLLFQSASTNSRVADAASQLANVQQTVRSTYAGQAGFSGLTNTTIASSLPSKMNVAGGGLRHAFNGSITVAPTNTGGGADSGFYITFAGVPAEACIKLATMDMGRAIVGLNFGTSPSTDTPPPIAPSTAQASCGSSGTTTLTWTVAG